jgi:hypothetical protein
MLIVALSPTERRAHFPAECASVPGGGDHIGAASPAVVASLVVTSLDQPDITALAVGVWHARPK